MPRCGVACSVGLEPHDIIVTSLPVGAASAFEPRDIGTGGRGEGGRPNRQARYQPEKLWIFHHFLPLPSVFLPSAARPQRSAPCVPSAPQKT